MKTKSFKESNAGLKLLGPLVAACAALMVAGPPEATGAPGDLLQTVPLPAGVLVPGGVNGVSVAVDCDGMIYYTTATQNPEVFPVGYVPRLYKMDKGGVAKGSAPIVNSANGSPVVIDEMAWDGSRNILWGVEHGPGVRNPLANYPIRVWQVTTNGVATLAFTTSHTTSYHWYRIGFAYDSSDDSLWISGDVGTFGNSISRYKPDGTFQGALTVQIPSAAIGGRSFEAGWMSGLVAGAGSQSGVLYLGLNNPNNCAGYIVKISKSNGNYLSTFYGPTNQRIQGLECDAANFATGGKLALWAREMGGAPCYQVPGMYAIELDPGSYECGGGGREISLCTLQCPQNVTVCNDPGQAGATVVLPPPVLTGSCTGLTYDPPSGSFFPIGTTTVTCSVNDGAGNISTCTFTVTVNDCTPTIRCPENIEVCNDAGQCGAVVTWEPLQTSDGTAVECSPESGSFFPVGTTTVICTATHASGNTSTCTFNVTVKDCEPPTIRCPENIVACNDPGQCSATVTWARPAVSDNCPGVEVSCSRPAGSSFPVGATTVICTATDAAGNTSTCSFTVTVKDCEPPLGACIPTVNPAGKNIPNAGVGQGSSPKSGQNPDGFYELQATDYCTDAGGLAIFVKDAAEGPCGGAFAAGPYAPGTKVKLTQSPGQRSVKPMAGVIVDHINTKGEPLLFVVDAAGNTSCQKCFVPPLPK